MGSLTSTQHAILVGSLLGDGTLRKQGSRLNALFEVNHSFEHKKYVDWKWHHFQDYVLAAPKSRSGKGARVAYRFTTQSLPVFTEYYHQFYEYGKKRIPVDLRVDALSLTVWFMDDGTRIRSAYYLNTQQFSLEDQKRLQKILLKRFGLNSALNKDKKYFRLRITSESSIRMQKIIEPYVVPILRYKLLTNDPVTTESKDEILAKVKKGQNNTPPPV